jgi:hypothetical protein
VIPHSIKSAWWRLVGVLKRSIYDQVFNASQARTLRKITRPPRSACRTPARELAGGVLPYKNMAVPISLHQAAPKDASSRPRKETPKKGLGRRSCVQQALPNGQAFHEASPNLIVST